MTATTTLQPTDAAPLPEALDYETPARLQSRRGAKRDLWLGIAAGLFVSVGLGFLLFGALMAMGLRDEEAGLIAFGTSCITLGGCFVALVIWFRRGAT